MKISGSGASYSLRRWSTCRAMMSRNESPRRTHSSDLARSMPIDVPRPPLSLITTVVPDRLGGDVVVDLDVGEPLHVERLDAWTRGSSRSRRARGAGSSGRTSRSRPRRPRRRAIFVARQVQACTTHTPIVGSPGACAQRSPNPVGNASRQAALRDQLLTARQPARPLAEVGEPPARSPRSPARRTRRYAARRPWRRTSRSAPSPAPAPLLDGLVAAGKRVILPVLLPDHDLDWARLRTARRRSTRARLRPARADRADGSGVDAIATADAVLVPGVAVSPDGDAARAAAAGATTGRSAGCRSAPSPACCSTTARSASTSPPSRTTGR